MTQMRIEGYYQCRDKDRRDIGHFLRERGFAVGQPKYVRADVDPENPLPDETTVVSISTDADIHTFTFIKDTNWWDELPGLLRIAIGDMSNGDYVEWMNEEFARIWQSVRNAILDVK